LCVGHAACLAGAVPKKPKLVPAIAVDQFRYDYLTRFLMKMRAARWGSQSWLQPVFSRPSAEHEGSLMAQEPPERRLRARLPAPRLFSRKAPPCARIPQGKHWYSHQISDKPRRKLKTVPGSLRL
jgi:hypothetical protein